MLFEGEFESSHTEELTAIVEESQEPVAVSYTNSADRRELNRMPKRIRELHFLIHRSFKYLYSGPRLGMSNKSLTWRMWKEGAVTGGVFGPSLPSETPSDQRWFWRAFNRLESELDKELIWLKYTTSWDMKRICAKLCISEANGRQRLSRARCSLADRIDAYNDAQAA